MKQHVRILSSAGAALLALAAFTGVAGAAQAGAKPPERHAHAQCFHAAQVSGWQKIDSQTLRVSVSPSRSYDLTLMFTPADQLDQEDIILKASPSGWICPGNGLGVSVATGGVGPRDFPVTKIALAPTPAEEKAMKEKAEKEKAEGGVH